MILQKGEEKREVELYAFIGPCNAVKYWQVDCPFCGERVMLNLSKKKAVTWCPHVPFKEGGEIDNLSEGE